MADNRSQMSSGALVSRGRSYRAFPNRLAGSRGPQIGQNGPCQPGQALGPRPRPCRGRGTGSGKAETCDFLRDQPGVLLRPARPHRQVPVALGRWAEPIFYGSASELEKFAPSRGPPQTGTRFSYNRKTSNQTLNWKFLK